MPEHGDAQLEDRGIRMRRGLRIDALRAAGEDDAHHAFLTEFGRRRAVVVDLRIDLALADAAGDDLRQLGTEIENSNCLRHAGSWGSFPRKETKKSAATGPPHARQQIERARQHAHARAISSGELYSSGR